MTRVEFFFNVSDKFAKVAELCEKAVAKGRQLTVFTENEAMSQELQQNLWGWRETSFLPSSLANAVDSEFSPIILQSHGTPLVQDDVLINLQKQHPPFFSRFRYLIEVVGLDEQDKVSARARFRFYKDRGYDVQTSDMAYD